jgi:endonuclease/exonuclease/phosphatase family metal-dependent hydrolase
MLFRLLFSLVPLLFFSCKKDQVDYEVRNSYFRNINTTAVYDTTLTVMTWNIQCGFPAHLDPWTRYDTGGTSEHIDSLANLIRMSGADIVALQEVPLDRSNIVVKRLLDSLAHRLGMNYAFAAHGYNDAYESGYPVRGQWGVAIMSRYPIEDIDSREVSYIDVWTRRSTLRVKLRLSESKMINVYSLHHKPMQDYSDLQKTADFVHESSLPVIVCGDFNTGPHEPEAKLGLTQTLPDSLLGIDQIFHSAEFIHLNAHGVYSRLSDHTPIWEQLKY